MKIINGCYKIKSLQGKMDPHYMFLNFMNVMVDNDFVIKYCNGQIATVWNGISTPIIFRFRNQIRDNI